MTDWKRYPDEKPIDKEPILYVSPTSGKVTLAYARYDRSYNGKYMLLRINGMNIFPDGEVYWMPTPEVPIDILPEARKAEIEIRKLREKLREAESLIAEMTAEKEQNAEKKKAQIEHLDEARRLVQCPRRK